MESHVRVVGADELPTPTTTKRGEGGERQGVEGTLCSQNNMLVTMVTTPSSAHSLFWV